MGAQGVSGRSSRKIGRNRPFPPFFCLFRPFLPEGLKSTWKIRENRRKKAFFLRYPRISLNPHLLNPHLRHSNLFSGKSRNSGLVPGNRDPKDSRLRMTFLRNTPSTAGNSMTGSGRPSPEPVLKKRRPQPYWGGGERILEMLWKPQMPVIIGLGASQPYS